jgi:hypothetical protein
MSGIVTAVSGGASIAARLLKAGMNPEALRTNALLQPREWIELDQAVITGARRRMNGIADLEARGLVKNLGGGMAVTVFESQSISDFSGAELTMDGISRQRKDRQDFATVGIPLPFIAKDYGISARYLETSRRMGTGLDTTGAEQAGMVSMEKLESMLFMGTGAYSFGGYVGYGYTDFPGRITGSLAASWLATGADPKQDLLDMKQDSIAALHYGPWVVYVPIEYEAVLGDDYTTNYAKSLRSRLLEIEGIEAIKTCPFLTGNNVLMIEMNPATIRLIRGMKLTNLEWDGEAGLEFNFKVLQIAMPQLRADYNGRSGIVHYNA